MALQFGHMLLSLAFVLGLLWLFAKVARARQGGKSGRKAADGSGGRIEMLSRRSLGRHSSIAVVRIGERTMVVGQTPQQITMLGETSAVPAATANGADPAAPAAMMGPEVTVDELMPGLASGIGAAAPRAWDAFIDRLREMTVRH